MAAVIQNITLDFSRENNNPVLAKRGDAASRFLRVSFTQLGEPMQIPSAATVSLNVRKNDGHYASSGGIINEDGTATVPIISQMLAVDGDAKADVRVIGADTSKLTTFDFILRVQETTVPDEVPISTDEFNDLVLALSEVAGFAGVKAELEAARGTYSTVGERLDDVDTELYTHTGDIASLGGRLTTAEQSIGTLDSGLTGALQRIADSEEAIPVMQEDIVAAQSDIAAIAGRTTTAEQAIDELSSTLDNLAWVTLKDVTSWGKVQEIVRAGLADKVFNIGDQFTVMKGSTPLVFDVIGIDHDTPTDDTKTHSMTLQLHDCLMDLQFDNIQALYYAESKLPAGTYNFTLLAGYDVANGGGKTLQFTLTQPVPAGGQIYFPWGYNTQSTDTTISTYASQTSTTVIETVPVTEGTGGIALSPTNHSHRIRYGSNNYAESPMRQWLNSDEAAGSVWTPSTVYSRPPSWATNTAGFLNGMDEEFISIVGEVKKITTRNTLTDGGGSLNSDEKFFLLSRSEVYAGNENNINEGEPYPFYSENSSLPSAGTGADLNRIKYLNDVARYWWLRSPYTSYAYSVRLVSLDGTLNSVFAHSRLGVAPACCII